MERPNMNEPWGPRHQEYRARNRVVLRCGAPVFRDLSLRTKRAIVDDVLELYHTYIDDPYPRDTKTINPEEKDQSQWEEQAQ